MKALIITLKKISLNHQKHLLKVGLMVLCLPFLKSCSAFKKTVELDMQPFSDNTTVLFHEAAKVDRPFRFKALANYRKIKPYMLLKEEAAPILYGLKGITCYSNQIVAISNSSMSEKGKNEQLTVYVKDVLERVEHKERLDSLGLTYDQIDSTIARIKRAKNFRSGIKAADPAVKTVVLSMYERLDKLEILIDKVAEAFENQIYQDNELGIANYLTFKELLNTNQFKLTQIYKAQTGAINCLDSLIREDSTLAKFFNKDSRYSEESFNKAEAFLLQRLTTIETMLRQLDDDKAEFIDMKQEIGEWHEQADEKIKIARNSLMVWSQSHKNLGDGIITPAILGIENITSVILPSITRRL